MLPRRRGSITAEDSIVGQEALVALHVFVQHHAWHGGEPRRGQ